jgi:hypothetical protein
MADTRSEHNGIRTRLVRGPPPMVRLRAAPLLLVSGRRRGLGHLPAARRRSDLIAGARHRRHGRGVTYVWIHDTGRRRNARGELYARRRGVRDSSRRSDSRLVCAPRPGSGARSRDAGDRRSRRHQLCSPALTVLTRAGAGSRVPQTQLPWLRD